MTGRAPLTGAMLLGFIFSATAGETARPSARTTWVPYRQTETKHILVRAKINGRGPFHFILDTGAPALFISTAAARKIGIEPDAKGWAKLDRFELEGGLVPPRVRGRVEDPFQLEAMNGLGLAGVRLDGIIGYHVLARYRLEFDFTRDKLGFTPLDFEPPAPRGLEGKMQAAGGLDTMAGVLKMLGAFLGKKPARQTVPRGYLGIEFADGSGTVEVRAVLADSPAARAGVKPGDRIRRFQGREIADEMALRKLAASLRAGEDVRLEVTRDGLEQSLTFKAGEGL